MKSERRNILKIRKRKKFQNSLNTLDEGFEDAFAYLANDVIHSRLRSTNCLERLNDDSAIRLIISPSAFGDQSSLISMRIV